MVIDHPAALDILSIIKHRIINHPRGLQKEIGPSEIGHPCDRWMGYKLLGFDEINPKSAGWRPTVGTAVHLWLAETFELADARIRAALGTDTPVWLVEQRLACGRIEAEDGYEVYGSCDLYYATRKIAVDWKIVGKATLDAARKKGHPGAQYRTQGHTYGRGWNARGMPVEEVAVFFLPASGELTDAVWWSEPYDEQVVLNGLARVSDVHNRVTQGGLDAVAEMPTHEHYCSRCPYWKFRSEDPRLGCPGDEAAQVNKPDPLESL